MFSGWSVDITWNAERSWWDGAQAWRWDHWAQAFEPVEVKEPQRDKAEQPSTDGTESH